MNRTISFRGTPLFPEQGFIIGNGDFCAAVFIRGDEIIWKLGKGDLWDRRVDYQLDPAPTDIRELQHGIEEEKWSAVPSDTVTYYNGGLTSLNPCSNPQRMHEVLTVNPSSRRPYPVPKPAGELALHLPADFLTPSFEFKLDTEQEILKIICTWETPAKLEIESFFAPDRDILCVSCRLDCPDADKILMPFPNDFFKPYPRCFFRLRRDADLSYEQFALENTSDDFPMFTGGKGAVPLPPPEVLTDGGIRQTFPPDPTFPKGFSYTLTPFAPDCTIQLPKMVKQGQACSELVPHNESKFSVQVKINTSLTGDSQEFEPEDAIRERCLKNAEKFWSRSSVKLGDSFWDSLWYETLHLQRSIYGRGPVPPGLMVPCTIGDYCRWHGDFHTNYNFQSPFAGMAAANHPELLISYENGVRFMQNAGQMIARRYFHQRGTYIPLYNVPIHPTDDLMGNGQYVRMVYMTGWIWQHHWERFLKTQDKDYLRKTCWPLLSDCALFFADFMKKGKDGCYHCYPSNCGEEHLNGDAGLFLDRRENLIHARNTIEKAICAAEILNEREMIPKWQDMLSHWPPTNPIDLETTGNFPYDCLEFTQVPRWFNTNPPCRPGHEFWTWYYGHAPLFYLALMREGLFDIQRDFKNLTDLTRRWHNPNGTLTAMSPSRYGRTGAWTETLGILGVITEMLMTCRNGIIELFPCWPDELSGEFHQFRADGALIVSAEKDNGKANVTVFSEQGGFCKIKYRRNIVELNLKENQNYHFQIKAE